ncbi:ROK family protein [Candidatus Parcubacteria bacterium]|nr:ROK family protein [Candidatus Parcubacteria bacterium]
MYLLFDIGGTNTRVAFCKDGKNISEPVVFATPQHFEEGINAIFAVATRLGAVGNIKCAGGGVPGVFDEKQTRVISSPNLIHWCHKPIQDRLEKMLGVPVFLENDAALVALGEAHYGAGKGFSIMEYITVSTGVGGARVVDGALDEKSVGFEPGQEIFSFESGENVTLEQTVSGTALEKRFGKKAKEITDPKVWEELSLKLAYGLHNTIVLWSPDVLVLGGSMIVGNPAIPVDRVEFHLKNILKIFPKVPIIKKAELGALGGVWGALEFIKSKE